MFSPGEKRNPPVWSSLSDRGPRSPRWLCSLGRSWCVFERRALEADAVSTFEHHAGHVSLSCGMLIHTAPAPYTHIALIFVHLTHVYPVVFVCARQKLIVTVRFFQVCALNVFIIYLNAYLSVRVYKNEIRRRPAVSVLHQTRGGKKFFRSTTLLVGMIVLEKRKRKKKFRLRRVVDLFLFTCVGIHLRRGGGALTVTRWHFLGRRATDVSR